MCGCSSRVRVETIPLGVTMTKLGPQTRGSWQLGTIATGVVAPVLLSAIVATSAFVPRAVAQDSAGEVPIGTFLIEGSEAETGAIPSDRAVDDRYQGEDPHYFFQRFESDIQQSQRARQALLDNAESELASGRESSAQRLLERLIADAPDTDEAKRARGHLANLYRGTPSVSRAGADLPWALGRGQSDRSPRVRPTRVSGALEDQFVSDVGDRIFFGAGSAELGTRALNVVRAQARFLQRRPELSVIVEGHTDDGAVSEDDELKLASDRAEAVRQRLVAEGVEEQRIAISPKGRSERVSVCPGTDCQAQNRRAVLVLMNGGTGLRAAQANARSVPLFTPPQ